MKHLFSTAPQNFSAVQFGAALCAFLGLASPLSSLQAQDAASLLAQERQRLEALQTEADRLSAEAARASAQGQHLQAVALYGQVLELLPASPSFALARERSAQSWLDAALTSSQLQIAEGDPNGAAKTLQVLAEHPLTKHNQELKLALRDLEPILEPAKTEEFAAKVAEANVFLRRAESQLRTSQYDEAIESYNRVLLLDPYNSAARRGLERVARAKEEYAQDAFNETRATMLGEVATGWELPVEVPEMRRQNAAQPSNLSDSQLPPHQRIRLTLRQTIVEQVDLAQTPLIDTLDIIRVLLRDKGVNLDFVIADSQIESRLISLSLNQINTEELLNLIAQQSKTSWAVERGVIVFNSGGSGLRRFAQNYSLDPILFRQLSLSQDNSPAISQDPFAITGNQVTQVSLEDTLQQIGISWDESTAAAYAEATGTLSFSGTQSQHEQVQQILNNLRRKSGQQVRIELRFIRVSLNAEEELSFETLLGPSNVGSERIFAAGGTPAQGENLPFNFPGSDPSIPVGSNLLSAGLRSGQEATGINSIDQLLSNVDALSTNETLQAPNIFSLGAVFTDPQYQILMRGLNQRGGVDTMAKPAIITTSGQQATISQIDTILYPADYDPPEIPQRIGNNNNNNNDDEGAVTSVPVTPAQPRDFTEDFEGITLDVTPTISPDGNYINLEVRPELRFLDGFINYGTPITQVVATPVGGFATQTISENRILQPVFRKYTLSTRVTLADGQSLVLGGLLQNNVVSYEDKIPFLGDIPFIGRLFQSKGSQNFKEAILFVVNADILDISGQPLRRSATNSL